MLALQQEAVVRGLEDLAPEEKEEVYRLLKLEVTPTPEGMAVSGALLCSESLPFEKGSPFPFSEASSGRSQYFARSAVCAVCMA